MSMMHGMKCPRTLFLYLNVRENVQHECNANGILRVLRLERLIWCAVVRSTESIPVLGKHSARCVSHCDFVRFFRGRNPVAVDSRENCSLVWLGYIGW